VCVCVYTRNRRFAGVCVCTLGIGGLLVWLGVCVLFAGTLGIGGLLVWLRVMKLCNGREQQREAWEERERKWGERRRWAQQR
jgi:hypothetical protein